jgi:predicted amidohydrolase YtcJ
MASICKYIPSFILIQVNATAFGTPYYRIRVIPVYHVSQCQRLWLIVEQDDLEIGPSFQDLYIMLDRVDVHCIWVSNKVLSLIPKDIGDIPGGEIPEKGVFCDNAMDIVLAQYPKPDTLRKTNFVKDAMLELNKLGIVGMHDAGVTPTELRLYEKLSTDDDWNVRVNAMVECEVRNRFCPDAVKQVTTPNGKFHVRSVKLFGGMSVSFPHCISRLLM